MKTSRTVVILEMLVCLAPFTWYFPLLMLFGSGIGGDSVILMSGLGLIAAWTIGLYFLIRGRWPVGDMVWLWIGALAGVIGAIVLFVQGLAIVVPTILVAGHWGAAAWRQQQGTARRRLPGWTLPAVLSIWFLGWMGAALLTGLPGSARDDQPAVITEWADQGPIIDLSGLGPHPRTRSVIGRLEPRRAAGEGAAADADSF